MDMNSFIALGMENVPNNIEKCSSNVYLNNAKCLIQYRGHMRSFSFGNDALEPSPFQSSA